MRRVAQLATLAVRPPKIPSLILSTSTRPMSFLWGKGVPVKPQPLVVSHCDMAAK